MLSVGLSDMMNDDDDDDDDDGRDVSCPLRDGMGWERDDFYVVLKKESPHRTTKEEAKVVVVPRMNSAGLSFGVVSLDKHASKNEEWMRWNLL